MKLHTYAGNVHALQSLIVARYNGVEIELPPFEMGKDNKTKAFLAKSPMGKVPVLETPEGCICEAGAIARYVARIRADSNMYGSSFFEAGLVDQWVEFAKNELVMPVGTSPNPDPNPDPDPDPDPDTNPSPNPDTNPDTNPSPNPNPSPSPSPSPCPSPCPSPYPNASPDPTPNQVGMWVYPILGFIQSNKTNTERAQEDLKRGLAVLQAP